jgi:monoamine oxidase
MQVYDSHARVQKYVRQFGLELDPIASTAPGSIMQVLGRRIDLRAGEPVAWPFPVPDGDKDVDLRGLFGKYVVPHLAAVRDADAKGELLERLGQFDRVSFSDFLRSQGASSAMVAVLNVGLPLGLGDGGDRHSALNLLREAAYRQARKQAFTIRGGTDRLPKALAARLGDRIHYDSPVVRIEQDRSGVRAVAMARGAPRSFTAERLICAMPFAVLRHVAISPALTREKRHAIDQLPNTSVAKVFVQTRSRFWIQAGLSGSAQSDRPPMLISERTINQPGTRGILEAYLAGAEARRVCALPERERIRWVVVELTRLFPALAEQAEGGATKCWDEDDWARGAYAWFQPGQMTSLLPHLAHPEGRIHFAGDHTSSTPGWMEGALQSAERVVGEVAAAS